MSTTYQQDRLIRDGRNAIDSLILEIEELQSMIDDLESENETLKNKIEDLEDKLNRV